MMTPNQVSKTKPTQPKGLLFYIFLGFQGLWMHCLFTLFASGGWAIILFSVGGPGGAW